MSTEKRRILIVDDDELARLEMLNCVMRLGHDVIQARNGVEALNSLRAQHCDLVLLDLLMPEIDGVEMLRRLRDDTDIAKTPVIVVSAVDESDQISKCYELGVVDHMAKPPDRVALEKSITKALELYG